MGKALPEGVRRRIRLFEWQARLFLGFSAPIHSEDRRILERVIFPYFSKEDEAQIILSVGCEFYTRHYSQLITCAEFWTMEPDPAKARWAATHHIEDKLENLHHHAKPSYFDVIVCNGVYGWGLNDRESCEIAFNNCFNCLRPGGALIIGWNDVPERRPFPLDELHALNRFLKWNFQPLQAWRYLTDTSYRHTFDFYKKPMEKRDFHR